jgi:DNA modification methylase
MIEDVLGNKGWRIIQGDVLGGIPLPDESVHCVVTSPPYWGLRDYGTAKWEGGSVDCTHKRVGNRDSRPRSGLQGGLATVNDAQEPAYREQCKCGALRIDAQLGLEATPDCGRHDTTILELKADLAFDDFVTINQELRVDVRYEAGDVPTHLRQYFQPQQPCGMCYVCRMVQVFREVRRVLRKDGTLWLNLGDSYNGLKVGNTETHKNPRAVTSMFTKQPAPNLKEKDLCMIPARVALALQADGWWIRSEITWCKRAPMPESVTDRPTSATEKIYLLTKSAKYFYDADAVREPYNESSLGRYAYQFGLGPAAAVAKSPAVGDGTAHSTAPNPAGRNMWSYWLLSPEPFPAAHFATFPTEIPRRAILAGTSEHGCCSECGAPWKRVVEREIGDPTGWRQSESASEKHAGRIAQGLVSTKSGFNRGSKEDYYANAPRTLTTGWQPTCAHKDAPLVPAVCLDPFSGAGTTVMTALRLGRRGIGLELNPEYVRLSEERIRDDCPMFNQEVGA